jgi:hypothetical protein
MVVTRAATPSIRCDAGRALDEYRQVTADEQSADAVRTRRKNGTK